MQQLILRVTERVHLADPAPEDPRSVSCIMLVLSLRELVFEFVFRMSSC